MSGSNGTTSVGNDNINAPEAQSELKGKGKAVDYTTQEMSMDEDEDSSDEDDGAEEEVFPHRRFSFRLILISTLRLRNQVKPFQVSYSKLLTK